MESPYIIGIAGGSCSGKTTIAAALARELGPEQTTSFTLDSYYYDLSHLAEAAISEHNFDHPSALDRPLLFNQVAALARGELIEKPVYDYRTHSRCNEPERIEPARFIVLESIFALYWEEVRQHMKTKVFVDVSHDVCLARRLERDLRERDRSVEDVTRRYEDQVRPMYEEHVAPTRQRADVVIDGTHPAERSVRAILHHIRRMTGERA